DSNLDATSGESIFLYKEGDVVVGRIGNGAGGNTPNPLGDVAFVVSIDADGKLNVAQYLAIHHDTAGSSAAAHDDTKSISNTALQVVLTVTDGDGDQATDTVNIGSHVRFDDDGPSTTITLVKDAEIRLDESLGGPADGGGKSDDETTSADTTDIAYGK